MKVNLRRLSAGRRIARAGTDRYRLAPAAPPLHPLSAAGVIRRLSAGRRIARAGTDRYRLAPGAPPVPDLSVAVVIRPEEKP